jgi:hypothetical protein
MAGRTIARQTSVAGRGPMGRKPQPPIIEAEADDAEGLDETPCGGPVEGVYSQLRARAPANRAAKSAAAPLAKA